MNGEVQATNAAPSIRHSNVAPASPVTNSKLGVASPVVPVGPLVIVVSGTLSSTVAVPASKFGVATSVRPSPFTSAAASRNGCRPVGTGEFKP